MNSVTEEESDLDVVMIKHINTNEYEYMVVDPDPVDPLLNGLLDPKP